MDKITIKGARTHNLKNINLEIPKNKLVVITGLSGSGKSSLAFDTIYAEGQRRYIESLNAYARQFLEMMEKPDIDVIDGLSPSIAIEQHSPSKNPRSTVGTVTEIYDYLRLLFARIGKPHCPKCHRPITSWSIDAMLKDITAKFKNNPITIKSPLVSGRTGTYEEMFERFKKKGFVNFEIDGKIYQTSKIPKLDRYKKHSISIIVDKFTLTDDEMERLSDSVEISVKESGGLVEILSGKNNILYSQKNSCPYCNISIRDLEPRLFSFNSPYGACPKCEGIGFITEIDEQLAIDFSKSIDDGALQCWENPVTNRTNRWKNSWRNYYLDIINNVAAKHKIRTDIQFSKLSDEHKKIMLYGDGDFEGVINNLKRRYAKTESEFVKQEIYNRYMKELTCPQCQGKRLKEEALWVLISSKSISDLSDMTVIELRKFIDYLTLSNSEKEISKLIIKEIRSRLDFLLNVGLGYLTLSRYSQTLSGGEAQRISLATQIGSGLTGVLYVLDEPTIGLHPRDNDRLITTLKSLRDIGNTLIVVEHDEKTIRNADQIIELGPGAGIYGGKLIFQGNINEIEKSEDSITGAYLSGKKQVFEKKSDSKAKNGFIEIYGANHFNLKNIDVKIPLGLTTVICGVSGSGKSTLLYEILYKGMMKKITPLFKEEPGKFKNIKGFDKIEKIVVVDQSPIGKTSRSNPATYTGFFDEIRYLFSITPAAKRKGYSPSRFSFNLTGGRCEKCKGEGYIDIHMQFLPDVHIICDECMGKRFNTETLEVTYKGKSIYDVIEMSVEEALVFFNDVPHIKNKLSLLNDVGLGYIKLGQSSTTLSGGESQRIKLAYELSKRTGGKNLYILDEPTTGLHFADVEKLLKVIQRLKEQGNTIVIIEHNIDVIKSADWIIELGPGGGPDGGNLIYEGYLSKIKDSDRSITKDYL
ncbi:MAG: excinuclease ABC subunit UvrA [Elusimicrobia bacterium]|jgi:excinuclease ABC subunit A|nr:excinuclease ABC subunit UvrA [Elusimicrobiota bacterium]